MRSRAPAPPKPRARFPPRVQAPAHIARPNTVVHLFAELVTVAPTGLAEKPLESGTAIVAHE
eukprot:6200978-Alexandrium_andersonii.AAC.1